MNRALWKKAVSDCWLQLVACGILLILFSWLFVWLMSLFKIGFFAHALNFAPSFLKRMIGVPPQLLATPLGRLSIIYVHVVTLLVCIGWAVGRGSDPITGEIGRGTMDHILSLPVRRVSLLVAPAVMATLGAAILSASVWIGAWIGLQTVSAFRYVAAADLLPGAVNLFAMTFCFTGITTFVSSFSRNRWQTILLAGGFFVLSLIVKLVGRMWPDGSWLKYCSFLGAFEPQRLILMPEGTGSPAINYNLTLLAIGLAGYAAAALVFSRRDIPAPL